MKSRPDPGRGGAARVSPRRTREQQVFLGILKAADLLDGELAEMLRPAELSPTQYNVLRILRAAGEEGLPCGQIGQRMLTRDPDITRLLDRMEKRGALVRLRDGGDRRVVRARLTPAGIKALGELDEPVARLHERQLGHLRPAELKTLAGLLSKARERTR